MDSSKVAFSVIFCGNAEGEVVPPYVVYKSVHLYSQWVAADPPGTRYNQSKSGWFDETTFTEVAWFAPLKKLWQKVLEDWKKSPKGLKHKGALPKEEFSKLLKKLLERLDENGAASENLVNGFRKCGLFPFNTDAVYELLPSKM